jgi:hypothetical protein
MRASQLRMTVPRGERGGWHWVCGCPGKVAQALLPVRLPWIGDRRWHDRCFAACTTRAPARPQGHVKVVLVCNGGVCPLPVRTWVCAIGDRHDPQSPSFRVRGYIGSEAVKARREILRLGSTKSLHNRSPCVFIDIMAQGKMSLFRPFIFIDIMGTPCIF